MTAARGPSVPGALGAIRTLAAVTWLRLLRGRALWVAILIACVPSAYASLIRGRGWGSIGDELLAFELLVTAVLAPMFVASSIGEDIEDRTATYLWSRPIPRWAVLAGKLAALVPLAAVLVLGGWAVAANIAWGTLPALATFVALALGVIAVAFVATAITCLAPRHGMALTIVYMLFVDHAVGALPAKLAEISISYQVRQLADPATGTRGALALVIVGTVWSLVALWRVRRLEA